MSKDTKTKANESDRELSKEELEGIAGGAMVKGDANSNMLTGTDTNDRLYGYEGNDMLDGGDGNDRLDGGDGSDMLWGGAGNDVFDGGDKDGANDMAVGGAGDDRYLWRAVGEGNDFFSGGEGNDEIKLWDLGHRGRLESAWTEGFLNISVKDASGKQIEITEEMFDERGDLILPDGSSGVIIGPEGETLTFEGVEKITKHYYN